MKISVLNTLQASEHVTYPVEMVYDDIYGYKISPKGNLSIYKTLSDSIDQEPLITYAKGFWRAVTRI